jgi:hypothetical protein
VNEVALQRLCLRKNFFAQRVCFRKHALDGGV